MDRPRIPPQLIRLLLVTLLIGATYVLARSWLTPATFGQHGHYRGAALEEAAVRQPVFAGAKACDECHSDTFELLAKDRHRSISCESCHGPSRTHAADPDIGTAKLSNAGCLRCHAEDPARPLRQPQIDAIDHFRGDRCIECHLPHQPKKSP